MSDGMASETATDLGLAILGGVRDAGHERRSRFLPRTRAARVARTSARATRVLEDAVLLVGIWTVGAGLAFMAYGVTVAVMAR